MGNASQGPSCAAVRFAPAASVMWGLLLAEVWAARLGRPAAASRAQSALTSESVASSKTNSMLRMNTSCRYPRPLHANQYPLAILVDQSAQVNACRVLPPIRGFSASGP